MMARLAACTLAFALVFAPVASALTHGPAQIAMQADHAAWHAEQGEHWHATDHGHPDAGDHDHNPTVILPSGGEIPPPSATEVWTAQATSAASRRRRAA